MKTVNNDLIRSFSPCYDPSEKVKDEKETLPVLKWVEKYRGIVPEKDIIWLLCRKAFLSDKELRLFAVWCAREALKLVANPDPRSVEACNVAERFANGDATKKELKDATVAAAYAYAADYAAAADPVAIYAAAAADSAAAADPVAAAADSIATYAAAAADYAAADNPVAVYAAAADSAAVYAAAYTREKQVDKLLTYFL